MELMYFSGGRREAALQAIISAGHNVGRIFLNDPIKWPQVLPTFSLAQEHGIPTHVISSRNDLESVLPYIEGKLCLSVGFRYLFPDNIISSASLLLNVHGSLLPKYRGARTLNWVIVNGEKMSGVTIHRVDKNVDAGPILLQRSFPISVFDTATSLYRKTLDFEPGVILEALTMLEAGDVEYQNQDDSYCEQFVDRRPEDSEIDPSRPLTEVYDQIRASDPDKYPAFFYVDGQKVCIRLWRESKPDREEDMI